MILDVQIYISQMKTFFEQNPKELFSLIGDSDSTQFFDKLEDVATENYESGKDVQLTQKQMINVLLSINKKQLQRPNTLPFSKTKFGKIFLN